MSKRKYCVFLYGKPISVGAVIKYDGESKKTARREHQLMQESPLVLMRAYPSVPVLMATPFSSMREAVGWYTAGVGLFSPQAFHGIVKRLKNGRGWKVVYINRDITYERMLQKLKMHSVYGARNTSRPTDWRETLDYFAKRLHGMGLEELTHAFMEQQKINPNEKNAFSCRAVGLVDAAPDREFQNDWVHPDGFPKHAVIGIDPGHPEGDKTSVGYYDGCKPNAESELTVTLHKTTGTGKSFMSLMEMEKFSPDPTKIDQMGGEVQLIMEPFPHTVVVEKKP